MPAISTRTSWYTFKHPAEKVLPFPWWELDEYFVSGRALRCERCGHGGADRIRCGSLWLCLACAELSKGAAS